MRVLITGANGIIGQKLISKIPAADHDLRLLVREKEEFLFAPPADIFRGDLLDKSSLEAATKNMETVIHLAGLTHTNEQELYYKINTLGTRNLLEACQKSQVNRFIFISSRAAGLNGGAYARSKFLAEEAVAKSNFNWVILRLAEVYGAGEGEAIAKLIKIIKTGYFIPIIGSGQFRLSPIFVDDAVAGILAVLKNPALSKKIYNLAGPEELTYNELVEQILAETKLKRKKLFLPVALVRMAAELFSRVGIKLFVKDQIPRLLSEKSSDISQAVCDFSFQPRNFRTGLKELLNRTA